MLKTWVLLLLVLFPISTVTGAVIQTRGIKEFGWRGLGKQPFKEIYWTKLSPMERLLLWPGILMFFLTLIAGIVWKFNA